MASPSWLPSWPSGWIDWEAVYTRLIPGLLPKGLFEPDGEAFADWKAIGESLGQVKKLFEWILWSYFPFRDSNALQIDRWETLFKLGKRGTIAERMAWVTSRFRQFGTMTASLQKAVMAGAWGSTDGSILAVHYQDPALIAANPEPTDDLTRREQQYLHFYDPLETTAPDFDVANDLIERAKPTWAYWTVGQYDIMQYDTAGSGWDRGRWGP